MGKFLKNLVPYLKNESFATWILITVLAFFVGLVALTHWFIGSLLPDKPWRLGVQVLCDLIVLIPLGWWLYMSFRTVDSDKMAVEIAFGWPLRFRDSGLRFVPYVGRHWYLREYPKKTFNLHYPKHEIMSMEGKFGPEDEYFGSQVVEVDSTVYLNFPREKGWVAKKHPKDPTGTTFLRKPNGDYILEKEKTHPLIKILRATVPTDEKELANWTEEAVISAIRIVLGNKTWKEAVSRKEDIKKQIAMAFMDPDEPLTKAGFRYPGIKIEIKEILPPKSIREAMAKVEEEKQKAKAAEEAKKAEIAENIGVFMGMMAQVTGRSGDELKAHIKGNPELEKEVRIFCMGLVDRDQRLKLGGIDIKFDFPKGTGDLTGTILSAIALFKTLSGGSSGTQNPGGTGGTGSGGGQTSQGANQQSDKEFFGL